MPAEGILILCTVSPPGINGEADGPCLCLALRRLPAGGNGARWLLAPLSEESGGSAASEQHIRKLEVECRHAEFDNFAVVRLDGLFTVSGDALGETVGKLNAPEFRAVLRKLYALCFGAPKPKQEHLPFMRVSVDGEEAAEVMETLASDWLTTGPKVAAFEKDFAEFVGGKYALAVNSATAGLHLALEAAGIGPGDKVITTPNTFTATAEVIHYLGADPVFVDIDARSFNISPDRIAAALAIHGKAVKAIMPVHIAGQACEMDAIMSLASDHGLTVIEDAAHALPTTYRDRMVGTIGDASVFSFYATKTITTGEGGMVVTDNPEIARRIGIMRLHGIDRNVFDRYTSNQPKWYYEVVAPGFKYNMTDIAAAIGMPQLRKAKKFQHQRQRIAEKYTDAFRGMPLRCPWLQRPGDMHSWHLYIIQLELERLTIDRNRFIELMSEAGVGTSVHFIPLHLQPYWRELYGLAPEDFPVALDVFQRSVSLPIFPKMTDGEVERVISTVQSILRQAAR